jgi:hypothetical protein
MKVTMEKVFVGRWIIIHGLTELERRGAKMKHEQSGADGTFYSRVDAERR